MDQLGAVRRYGSMRRVVLILLILAFGVTSADARKRKHRYHHYRDVYVAPPDFPRMTARDGRYRALPQERSVPIPAPEGLSGRPDRGAMQMVPPDWQLQPPDPNWKGKRYLSPDGAAWFAAYATPVEQEPIAAHMRAIAFVDGEEISYLQGERDWIAVSGLKADRIFYRKAALACGGKSWRHVAFEYPAEAKRSMDPFVTRAARALDNSVNEGCEAAVSSSR